MLLISIVVAVRLIRFDEEGLKLATNVHQHYPTVVAYQVVAEATVLKYPAHGCSNDVEVANQEYLSFISSLGAEARNHGIFGPFLGRNFIEEGPNAIA